MGLTAGALLNVGELFKALEREKVEIAGEFLASAQVHVASFHERVGLARHRSTMASVLRIDCRERAHEEESARRQQIAHCSPKRSTGRRTQQLIDIGRVHDVETRPGGSSTGRSTPETAVGTSAVGKIHTAIVDAGACG